MKKFFPGGEAVGHVAQRHCAWKCPMPGTVQDQYGWGFEQFGLVEGVPDHARGIGIKCV